MFDKKSEYALNKYDQDSIIYISVSGRIRLTRADFSSEEEFLKWKTWSDADYHETEKKGRSFNDNRVALAVPCREEIHHRDCQARRSDKGQRFPLTCQGNQKNFKKVRGGPQK